MKRALLLALALLPLAPLAEAAPTADVFRTRSFAVRDLSAVSQWTDALVRSRAEAAALRAPAAGEACDGMSAAAWCAAVAATRPLPPARQVYEINRFVNAMVGRGDAGVPPAGEPWPGLAEALNGRGGGVAAAVVKYLSLREVGIPAEALRIVVAEDVLRGSRIALVLARADDGGEVVLAPDTDVLRGAARSANLRAFYSFNEATLWMHIPEPQETTP